ncbi:transcription-repair coupling factor [Buchnera aphidicola]|uniref:transcription-repair coupling factor n=1 Tax=Buchnera aphidicola TaxID=9 RepID=UPI003464A53E
MTKKYISELKHNDLVIHLKHGLGQYKGLINIAHNSFKADYLVILYANEVKIYVPITHLYLVKPYIVGSSKKKITLNKLGCSKWNKERKCIFKKIQDSAIKILDIQSQRMKQLGFSFNHYHQEYELFCKKFPFKITKDQNKAMQSVLLDMKKKIPMDRIICGDVGFGKTEIAMRASFVAYLNKKQVLILVPTTLLAQQHYKNFKARFSDYAITIDIFSRFRSMQEEIYCIDQIKKGKINIFIGTHKILSKKLHWFNLGILIIDEEHRFGVYQKESIKKRFKNIDILTLTATPIPRTLNMAIQGIRDLSIISTPPKNRIPIRTFVKEYDNFLIKKIILNELSRKGQVYYVCNKIQNLEEKLIQLRSSMPEVKFQIGHGKMHGNELKKIMHDFYDKKFQVLISTTIIETGIDIPTVNTIIIENADLFGLAQLHQMRGRVGRSNIQSYAWFLVENLDSLSSNAKKRLQVIQSLNELGSGFDLSMHDLNIRGTGELLGYHQSGKINNVELSLYIELLQKTIEFSKNRLNLSLTELKNYQPKIKLSVPYFLPEKYIPDPSQRLYFYKKIYLTKKNDDLLKIQFNLINKFGKLPIQAKYLILINKIRILSNIIGITKIECDQHGGIIQFSKNNCFNDINWLTEILQKEPNIWKINNSYSIQFTHNLFDYHGRINWVLKFLKKIKNFC